MEIVYFSNVSNNTHRFVEKLGRPVKRIPLRPGDLSLQLTEPYILFTPTYGGGHEGGAVPKQVIKFLNDPHNRDLLRGVICAGNTNFGHTYALAGKIISAKCNVPLLYNFELLGTTDDVLAVESILHHSEQMELSL